MDNLESLQKKLAVAQEELARFERIMPLASAAASVVHDVNNSLGVIQSTAQFVLRHLKPSTQEKEAWELVERNVESIRRLLKSYLGLARQTEKPKELTSINELIERVTHFIDVQCTKNNIRIIKDLSMPLPRVMVESSAVESAILNLSLNAIEAIGQGGTLKFTTQDSESDKSVKFILEDSGPGISKETMENIFTPFFTTKENGTGMGLYSVKAILTQNNGKISCESQPGKTRMILTFFNA